MGKLRNSLRSDNEAFLSIFCPTQLAVSEVGLSQRQGQRQGQRQVKTYKWRGVGTVFVPTRSMIKIVNVRVVLVFAAAFDFKPLRTL